MRRLRSIVRRARRHRGSCQVRCGARPGAAVHVREQHTLVSVTVPGGCVPTLPPRHAHARPRVFLQSRRFGSSKREDSSPFRDDCSCPLCGCDRTDVYHQKHALSFRLTDSTARHKRWWTYLRCPRCELVFVHPVDRLDPESERARYDMHENSIEQEGYVRFLDTFLDACEPFVSLANSERQLLTALDFGCGPGDQVLSTLLQRRFGCSSVHVFDPLYSPSRTVLQQENTYDIITCTEVLEHVYRPKQVIAMLYSLLKPSGCLCCMTSLRPRTHAQFVNWHYHRDPTHVSFFSEPTFSFLAEELGADLHVSSVRDNVVVLVKPQ